MTLSLQKMYLTHVEQKHIICSNELHWSVRSIPQNDYWRQTQCSDECLVFISQPDMKTFFITIPPSHIAATSTDGHVHFHMPINLSSAIMCGNASMYERLCQHVCVEEVGVAVHHRE